MTGRKHSVGPWLHHPTECDMGIVNDAKGEFVCEAYYPDARLIAAAPEMLAMLTRAADALRMRGSTPENDVLLVDIESMVLRGAGQ